MPTAIAVIMSDNHLAPGAWKGRPEISGDSYRALEQGVNFCLQYRLPLYLAGDFFDANRPSAQDLQAALVLNKLTDVGLGVFYIQAQHDYDKPSYLSVVVPKAVDLDSLKQPVYIPGGSMLKVWGRNFMSTAVLNDWLTNGQQACDVMIMHQLWNEFMGMHGQASLERIEKCRVLVTGDCHQYKIITTNRGVRVLSPGATQMQAIKEPTEHYLHILYDDLSLSYERINSRQVVDIVVSNSPEVDHMVANPERTIDDKIRRVPHDPIKPIVRFRIANPIQGAIPRLQEAFDAFCFPFFLGEKETKAEEVPLMFTDPTVRVSALQEAVSVMAENFPPDDPSLHDAMNLVESPLDPVSAVRQLRQQYVEVPSVTPA